MAKSHAASKRAEIVGLDLVRTAAVTANGAPAAAIDPKPTHSPDYFIERDGVRYAGHHLLIDMWGASNLDNQPLIEEALLECIRVSGATLLHIHLHEFQENGGISGVAVLAESHISIHTWPERGYAAIDIFMCGAAQPLKSVPVLRRYFEPQTIQLGEQKRGLSE